MCAIRVFLAVCILGSSLELSASGVQAADDVCAKLFAALASGKDAPGPKKKKLNEFTEAEIDKITTERACLKHFPWPKGEFFVDDADSGKKAVSVDRMGEISASIRQVCDAWPKEKANLRTKVGELGAVEAATVRLLSQGTDREQLALYGEFFYLLKLRNAGRPKEIVQAIEKIKQSDPLKIELAVQDELEDSTYFTKQTLRCMIQLINADAASGVYRNEPKRLLPVITDILENWPILESHTKMGGDPRRSLLTALGDQRQGLIDFLHLKGDYWKQTAALGEIECLAGATLTGDSLQLYLRASSKQVLALAVSRAGRASQLTPEQASNALNAISRKEMSDDSTQVMRLFQVLPDGDGFSLRFPDGTRIGLSQADYAMLAAGKKLSDEHPLSRALKGLKEDCLALYSHPLMRKPGPEMVAARDVTFGMQKAYPENKIHRDPLSGTTSDRAKALNEKKVDDLGDLLILVADKSFRVPQNATVNNISKTLTDLGVKPVAFMGEKYAGPTGRCVIVISGHTSKELAEYVRALGDAGYFKDNYVIFNSCESPLTEQLMAELTSRYQAAAAVGFEKKIGVDEVQNYLLSFVKKLKEMRGQGLFRLLLDTLRENRLNAVWNLCSLDRRMPVAC